MNKALEKEYFLSSNACFDAGTRLWGFFFALSFNQLPEFVAVGSTLNVNLYMINDKIGYL